MTGPAWFTLALFVAALLALAYPLAIYITRIGGSDAPIGGWAGKFERLIYRAAGVDAAEDMP
jgi:K+-transporting ATPase ATPase A chain